MNGNFKRDVLNYFLSIIIPGVVNFFSIPLMKWFLHAERYGEYALWYNAFLIIISGGVNWLGMSLLRFRADFDNNDFFYKHIARIALWLGGGLFVLALITVYLISGRPFFALFFALALCLYTFQSGIMAISQSNFLSKWVVLSESVRTLSFILSASILLNISTTNFLEKIFFSLMLSNALSFLFLKNRNGLSLKKMFTQTETKSTLIFPYKAFFAFGIPLIFWYFCSTTIPYLDKLLIAHKFGNKIQGDYQSVFDLVYRAVGILLAPVLTALFPHLTKMYRQGDFSGVLKLLRKLLMLEALFMVVAVAAYYLGFATILMKMLHISNHHLYLHAGASVLVVSFIWQMAMLLHKPFELLKRTDLILKNNIAALIVTIIALAIVYKKNLSFIWYPAGIFSGSVCYALLCMMQVKRMLNRGFFKSSDSA